MSLFLLMYMFFKIGIIGFGGGYAIMSLLLSEGQKLVGFTVAEFAELTALELIVPGPIAVNGATYIGYIKEGFLGSVLATGVFLIAPTIFTLLAVHFVNKFKDSTIMKGILKGIKAATIGVIAAAAFTVLQGGVMVDGGLNYGFVGIFLAGLVLMTKLKVDPIIITVLAAVAGVIVF